MLASTDGTPSRSCSSVIPCIAQKAVAFCDSRTRVSASPGFAATRARAAFARPRRSRNRRSSSCWSSCP